MLAEWLKHAKGSGELPRTLKSLHNALVDRDCRPEADKLVEEVKRINDYKYKNIRMYVYRLVIL